MIFRRPSIGGAFEMMVPEHSASDEVIPLDVAPGPLGVDAQALSTKRNTNSNNDRVSDINKKP